ncbi:hypothetical protein TB1_034205 [Malus domestica]
MNAHSHACLSHMAPSTQPSLGVSDQSTLTDDEEGWTLVTYKKTRVEQATKYSYYNNRKPKRNVRVVKLTYAEETMKQEPHIPIFLDKCFPKDFFQQCTTAACHMVEVEIEELLKGKVITIKEEKTPTPEESMVSYFSIEEAL